ncbi:MAG: hypothetical protein R2844_06790 [Caldilineales bacterium]
MADRCHDLGIIFLAIMLTDADYRVILAAVSKGISVTIRVSIISYAIALVLGLIIGLGRVSSHRVINEVATFMSRSSAVCRCWCCCTTSCSPARPG